MKSKLPIDTSIIQKHREIPELIAQLSYVNRDKTIEYIRLWGEKRIPITELHSLLTDELENS